jgi:hypothetical protein
MSQPNRAYLGQKEASVLETENGKKGISVVTVGVVLIIMVSLLVSVLWQKGDAGEQPSEERPARPAETPADIPDMTLYGDAEGRFSLSVPAGFVLARPPGDAEEGDVVLFAEKSGKATVEARFSGYAPEINETSSESVALGGNVRVIDFSKGSAEYTLVAETGDTIFAEYALWDRGSIVTVRGTAKKDAFADFADLFSHVFGSLEFERKAPIPEGFSLAHVGKGNFEFGLPEGFIKAPEKDGARAAASAETGAVIYARADEGAKALTKESLADEIGGKRTGLLVLGFSRTGNAVEAKASYVSGGGSFTLVCLSVNSGLWRYTLLLDCPDAALAEVLPLFEESKKLFRIFG